jgi:hypothetical protein
METNQTREPWNKGKLVGPKPPLKPKDTSGPSESTSNTNIAFVTWPCSTWRSTASYVAAIW